MDGQHDTDMKEMGSLRCRLLELPAELRIRIYEFALGHQFIHVDYHKVNLEQPYHFRLKVCRHYHESYGTSQDISQDPHSNVISGTPTHMAYPGCGFRSNHWTPPQWNVALLRASKQINNECKQILMKNNTFAFNHVMGWREFIVWPHTIRYLTSIAFAFSPKSRVGHVMSRRIWELYVTNESTLPVPHFPSLRHLQLCLTPKRSGTPAFLSGELWTDLCWTWGFLIFAVEDLRDVSIIDSGYEIDIPGGASFKPSLQDYEEYEKSVRAAMLVEWSVDHWEYICRLRKIFYNRVVALPWYKWERPSFFNSAPTQST